MGQGISLIGTWMQRIAQQWVIYKMTGSAVSLGLIGVFQYLPMLLFSLFAGSLISRFKRKKFLIIMQILQTLQALVLTILIWQGIAKPWHIMIMAGFLGLINAFDMPARHSFFVELVGKEALPSAIGLNSTIVNIGKIIGPAIGGYFLANFGETACFLFNTISFFAVILGLIKIEIQTETKQLISSNVLQESYQGLVYVIKNKKIFIALGSLLIVSTLGMNNDVIIPVYAREGLNLSSKEFSFMYSALGFGSLLGALKNASRKNKNISVNIIYISGISLGFCLVVLSQINLYFLSLSILFIMGYAMVMFMNFINAIIQLSSDENYRIRAVSIYTLIFTGTTPIGNYLTGYLLENYGITNTLLFSGLSTVTLLFIFNRFFGRSMNEIKN